MTERNTPHSGSALEISRRQVLRGFGLLAARALVDRNPPIIVKAQPLFSERQGNETIDNQEIIPGWSRCHISWDELRSSERQIPIDLDVFYLQNEEDKFGRKLIEDQWVFDF